MRGRALRLALALAACLSMVGADTASATSSRWIDRLRVEGGEEAWHSDERFVLNWTNAAPVGVASPAVTAIDYRVLGPWGNVVEGGRIAWAASQLRLSLPWGPGEYTAEVWLEDASGQLSPPASARLRLDQAQPSRVVPQLADGWIGGGAATQIRLPHPAVVPISGIRGYAVSIDSDPEGVPCAGENACTDAETDMRGGIGDDFLVLSSLPEGTSYVHLVAVSGSGMRSVEVGTAVAHVDSSLPHTVLRGAPDGWAGGPVRLTATATDTLSGMRASGPGGPFTAIAVDGGVPTTAAGDTTTAIVSGEGLHRVEYYARDAAGNVNDLSRVGTPPESAAIRIDTSPPKVAFANVRNPADPELIEATVTDSLSGPGSSRGSISVRPSASGQAFEPLPTSAGAGRLQAHWNSDDFARGSYEFRVTGYDAAGNPATSGLRLNGTRMVLANPVKSETAIEAGFGGRRLVWHRCARVGRGRRCRREEISPYGARPASRTVPFGRGLPFSGRLTGATGSPLAHQPVQLVETFDAGAGPDQRTTTVETTGDGTFLARLAPGPSRRVEAVFPGTRTLARVAASSLRLSVLAGVRLRASSGTARIGGAPVLFSGRLAQADAPIPPGGLPIELQFRLPGLAWTEFRTIQTDRHGRFAYPYSFTDDDSRGARFEFRAFSPTREEWPYEPAASRPVSVTGR